MPALIRLDLWDEIQAAGGKRRAVVKNWLACTETVHVDGTDTMTLTLHGENEALETLDTPAGELNADLARVIRAVHADGTFVERRIETFERNENQGDSRITVTAHGLMYELGHRGMVYRRRASGGQTHHFQAANQTAAQHLANYILPALWDADAPYWMAGTLEGADEPVTVVYDMDSPLSALRKLVNAHAAYLELAVDYSPFHGRYRIHLLHQRGGEAPIIRIRGGPALVQLGIQRTLRDTVNRVYGFGGTDPEVGRAQIGQNVWDPLLVRNDATGRWDRITDPAGGPGPIAYDGQYTGDPRGKHRLVSLNPSHAQFFIEESSADRQEFRLSVAQGGASPTSGYYRIADPVGDLAYVERRPAPSGRTFPVRTGHVERPEVSGVINLTFNPLGRDDFCTSSAGLPCLWSQSGNPLIAKETNPVFVRTGASSRRVTFTQIGQFVSLPGVGNAFLSAGRISFYADVMVISGEVDVKALVFLNGVLALPDGTSNNSVLYPDKYAVMHGGEDAPTTYRSTRLNEWERLGIEGLHDCRRWPVLEVRLRIQPRTIPTTVIIDAGQVTNTMTFRELVVGGGGTALLQAANARLLEMADYAETLRVQTLDLGLVDDVQFPFRDYVLGGGIMIDVPQIGVAVRTRIMGWDRDWLDPANLRLQIAGGDSDVLRVLASRLPTAPPPPPETGG